MDLTPGEINFINKDTVIYKQGDSVDTIGFITEGTVKKSTMQTNEEIRAGNFIGVHSLYSGKYTSTYIAESDVKIKVLKADSPESLAIFLSENQQIHEKFLVDLNIFFIQLYELYNKLYIQSVILYKSTEEICEQFHALSNEPGFFCNELENKTPIEEFAFSSQHFYEDYLEFSSYIETPEQAYADMQTGRIKFFNTQIWLIREIYEAYHNLVEYAQTIALHLAGKIETSILTSIVNYVEYLNINNLDKSYSILLMRKLLETIKTLEFNLKRKCFVNIKVDYFFINTCIKNASKEIKCTVLESQCIPPERAILKDSLNIIFAYVSYPEDFQIEFRELLSIYIKLEDKQSKKDEDRRLFKKLTEKYYELYEMVFLKYVNDLEKNKVLDLLLDFGFIDDNLLTQDEQDFLLKIEINSDSSPCQIFRMKDWLVEIYEGRELTSKNEFDEDYSDYVRRERKERGLTKEDEKKLLNNKELRVKFEIQNVLRYNNRLINGRMLSFVPFLYSDCFESTMEKMYLSPESINTLISSIRDIDYSLFYRQFMYADTKAKIDKELIQKEVFPIIVLFPIAGVNGIMWQETTRRRSDSAGRFFMPSFFIGNLEDTILKLLGKFRWELCKQMLGVSWNNILLPSLTAKYFDYVQFYKKDNELSPDRKEALKKQIVSCHNKINEVFIADYMIWIKHESSGAVRLNSVARRILATHCPFSKEIRDNLQKQPLFEKAMLRYNLDKDKKIKELRNRFMALEKKKATLTQELLDTQHFYNDL